MHALRLQRQLRQISIAPAAQGRFEHLRQARVFAWAVQHIQEREQILHFHIVGQGLFLDADGGNAARAQDRIERV